MHTARWCSCMVALLIVELTEGLAVGVGVCADDVAGPSQNSTFHRGKKKRAGGETRQRECSALTECRIAFPFRLLGNTKAEKRRIALSTYPDGHCRGIQRGGLRLVCVGGTAPLCDIPSCCCSFTGPWTVTRSSLRMLRRVAAFCRPLRPVLLLVSFPRGAAPPPSPHKRNKIPRMRGSVAVCNTYTHPNLQFLGRNFRLGKEATAHRSHTKAEFKKIVLSTYPDWVPVLAGPSLRASPPTYNHPPAYSKQPST